MPLRPLDVLMGLAVPLVWGMGVVFSKAAIEHFPPILLMALRFTVTALVLVWFVKPPWRVMGQLVAIAFISAAVQYSLTFNGLRGVDASTAVLVLQVEVPFLVLLGATLLHERVDARKWLGIAISLAGVGLIAGEPRLDQAWGSLALLVGGAFSWALGQVMVRRLGEIGGLTMIAWVAVFAAPQLFVFSLVFERDHLAAIASADWVVWSTVVYLGLVMTALGYSLWYSLIGRHPVSRVGPFLLLMPIFSVLGGMILLGETLTPMIALGGIIVITGVAVIMVRRGAGAGAVTPAEAGARRYDAEP
ncbi:MAG: DMT family transporter [Alphaproteobacteria bacterium]